MSGGPGAGPVEQARAQERLVREQAVGSADPLTLATMCECGHTRKDHRGLRMEATGPCLECDCEEFRRARARSRSHEQMSNEIHDALDQLHSAREILAGLRALLSNAD